MLKNAVRDWAQEGSQERDQSYGRICEELERCLPAPAKVLVPGCGLGRLPLELSRLGYEVEVSLPTAISTNATPSTIRDASTLLLSSEAR